jgi:hypothetical protein
MIDKMLKTFSREIDLLQYKLYKNKLLTFTENSFKISATLTN